MVHLFAERSDVKSNVKLGGFRSQLQASYMSSHTEELCDTTKQSVCGWQYIYIYIYIYIYGNTETDLTNKDPDLFDQYGIFR